MLGYILASAAITLWSGGWGFWYWRYHKRRYRHRPDYRLIEQLEHELLDIEPPKSKHRPISCAPGTIIEVHDPMEVIYHDYGRKTREIAHNHTQVFRDPFKPRKLTRGMIATEEDWNRLAAEDRARDKEMAVERSIEDAHRDATEFLGHLEV